METFRLDRVFPRMYPVSTPCKVYAVSNAQGALQLTVSWVWEPWRGCTDGVNVQHRHTATSVPPPRRNTQLPRQPSLNLHPSLSLSLSLSHCSLTLILSSHNFFASENRPINQNFCLTTMITPAVATSSSVKQTRPTVSMGSYKTASHSLTPGSGVFFC
jgi:hypothetical protein